MKCDTITHEAQKLMVSHGKTLKLTGEKRRENFNNLEEGQDFLDRTSNHRRKSYKMGFIKMN